MKHAMKRFMLAVLAIGLAVTVCYGSPAKSAPAPKTAKSAKTGKPAASTPPGSLLYQSDVKTGSGAEATAGMTVSVQYTGWLYDAAGRDHRGALVGGTQGSDQPYEFKLGAGQAIQGWDEGVAGMKVGGERLIAVPGLAYGTRIGNVTIPPGTPLLYDITLLGVH